MRLIIIVAIVIAYFPLIVYSTNLRRRRVENTENGEENDVNGPKQEEGDLMIVEFWPTTTNVEKQRQPRIVGGYSANRVDYPYFVQWDGCGATLVSKNVILTAAHCLERQTVDPTVRIGAYDSNPNMGLTRMADGFAIHPHYVNDGITISYDFALLALEESVSESDIEPVQLNRDNDHPKFNYDELTVIGRGLTDYGTKEKAEELQELKVPYVPHDECAAVYGGYNVSINEHAMLCAGGKVFEDPCKGDSGGPILDDAGVQVGVISFGANCGNGGWPGVYSRISSAVDWIDEFICLNAQNASDCPHQSQSQSQSQQLRFPVQFNIYSDDFPNEISWDLSKETQNGAGSSIFFAPFGTIQNIGLYSKILYLRPGKYKLEVKDEAKDGLCCEYGEGNYEIGSGMDYIKREGTYTDLDTVEFVVAESGRLWDTRTSRLRIDITFDNRPNETAWILDSVDYKMRIFLSNFGDVTSPGLMSYSLNVPDGNYWLVVMDKGRNGICCNNGQGSIVINKLVDGKEILIASHRGNFTFYQEFYIKIP